VLRRVLEELRGHPDALAQEPSTFVEHPSSFAAASVSIRRASLRRRRDAARGATEAVGARRGARDTRRDAVVIRRDAFGPGTAALGARRAAVRLCFDARGLRRTSVHVGTDAPSIPTDALLIRKDIFVGTDGCSTRSNGRHERSVGNSIERRRRSTRTTGCSARTAGRSRDSWGRRAKARTGFAKSHAILTHFAAYPLRFGSGGADARSGPRHARRPFARTSGCRRWESRRQPRKGRCVRRAKRGGAAPTPHAPSTSASRAATS
jgi:hypothetical protein